MAHGAGAAICCRRAHEIAGLVAGRVQLEASKSKAAAMGNFDVNTSTRRTLLQVHTAYRCVGVQNVCVAHVTMCMYDPGINNHGTHHRVQPPMPGPACDSADPTAMIGAGVR